MLRELLLIGLPSSVTGVVDDEQHNSGNSGSSAGADGSDRTTSHASGTAGAATAGGGSAPASTPASPTASDVQNQRAQRPPADGSRKRVNTPAKQKSLRTRRVEWLEARDPDGCTPLHVASSAGNSIASQLLIDAGADVDATDVDGATPLPWLGRFGGG